MKYTALVLMTAIIIFSNAIALIGTATTRGASIQTIQLSERELPRLNADLEDSGVDLALQWNQVSSTPMVFPLEQKQLEAAGFVFKVPPGEATKSFAFLPREAFVALEYEGPKWQEWEEWRAQAKPAPKTSANAPSGQFPQEQTSRMAPHLFVVDASKNLSELRTRYPEQNRYLIVRGLITAHTEPLKDPDSGRVVSYRYSGRVQQISPNIIHVPLPHSRAIASLKRQAEGEPRYTVTLKYGRNLEPWVEAVNLR